MKTAMIQIVTGLNSLPIHETLGSITLMWLILLGISIVGRLASKRGNSIYILEKLILVLAILIVVFGTATIVYAVNYNLYK